jgi:LDH2 family malate/lactate/ureidoglycolate dehydrogenase
VMFPGERGAATLSQRERDGIPLPVPTWEALVEAAERRGIAQPVVAAAG